MSAMERLRELLDERGVEWKAPASYDGSTKYDTIVGDYWFHEYDGKITVHGLTPEQAIDATLGAGTCHLVPYNENYATCSECGISLPRFHGGWWFYCPGCGRHLMGEKVVDE